MARKVKSGPSDADSDRVRKTDRESDETAIRSGDLQGLRDEPSADSESVKELLDEGQAYEAMVVNSIENTQDADAGEVKTREVPEDDVPPEYSDRFPDEPKEE